jgi:hypothetical protein
METVKKICFVFAATCVTSVSTRRATARTCCGRPDTAATSICSAKRSTTPCRPAPTSRRSMPRPHSGGCGQSGTKPQQHYGGKNGMQPFLVRVPKIWNGASAILWRENGMQQFLVGLPIIWNGASAISWRENGTATIIIRLSTVPYWPAPT